MFITNKSKNIKLKIRYTGIKKLKARENCTHKVLKRVTYLYKKTHHIKT